MEWSGGEAVLVIFTIIAIENLLLEVPRSRRRPCALCCSRIRLSPVVTFIASALDGSCIERLAVRWTYKARTFT